MSVKAIYQVRSNDPREISLQLQHIAERMDETDRTIEKSTVFATYSWESEYTPEEV